MVLDMFVLSGKFSSLSLSFPSFFISPFRIGWDCLTKLNLLTHHKQGPRVHCGGEATGRE